MRVQRDSNILHRVPQISKTTTAGSWDMAPIVHLYHVESVPNKKQFIERTKKKF